MPYYSRPEELLKHFQSLLETHKGLLGFQSVILQDENLITDYPAVEVSMGPVNRNDHGTQQFELIFTANFWIYHANYEQTHRERAIADMELATNVVKFLHQPKNRRLENEEGNYGLITGSGRVTDEVPGFVITEERRRIIATQLVWAGLSHVLYQDS